MLWEASTAAIFRMWSRMYLGEIVEVAREIDDVLEEARGRGDLAVEAGVSSGLPNLVFVLAGDIERAEARCAWSGQRVSAEHPLQLYFDLLARCHLDLALGRPEPAFERVEAAWPLLERRMLLRVQWLRIDAWFLRGRCAHAAFGRPTRTSRALGMSRRARAALGREDLAVGPALSRLLDLDAAAVGALQGKAPEASDVGEQLERAELRLYARALADRDADPVLRRVFTPARACRQPSFAGAPERGF